MALFSRPASGAIPPEAIFQALFLLKPLDVGDYILDLGIRQLVLVGGHLARAILGNSFQCGRRHLRHLWILERLYLHRFASRRIACARRSVAHLALGFVRRLATGLGESSRSAQKHSQTQDSYLQARTHHTFPPLSEVAHLFLNNEQAGSLTIISRNSQIPFPPSLILPAFRPLEPAPSTREPEPSAQSSRPERSRLCRCPDSSSTPESRRDSRHRLRRPSSSRRARPSTSGPAPASLAPRRFADRGLPRRSPFALLPFLARSTALLPAQTGHSPSLHQDARPPAHAHLLPASLPATYLDAISTRKPRKTAALAMSQTRP